MEDALPSEAQQICQGSALSWLVALLTPWSYSLFALQELEELLTEIKDISVVLGIDNACKLDMSRIVEEVRAQYEALALRSWEEAEALTRRKVFVSLSDLYWGEAGKEEEERSA